MANIFLWLKNFTAYRVRVIIWVKLPILFVLEDVMLGAAGATPALHGIHAFILLSTLTH